MGHPVTVPCRFLYNGGTRTTGMSPVQLAGTELHNKAFFNIFAHHVLENFEVGGGGEYVCMYESIEIRPP